MLFQIAMKINWREMRFSIMKGNFNHEREFTICDKENHSKANVRRRKDRTWKTRGLVENTGSTGKHRAWKQRSRGKHGRGKHGFWWETLGVENTGTQWKGKHGVKVKKKKKKTRGTIISSNKIKILLF